jgi:hypothetical protein
VRCPIAESGDTDHPERIVRLVLTATTAVGLPRPDVATRAFESGDPAAVRELVFTPEYLSTHPEARSVTQSHATSPLPGSCGSGVAELPAGQTK